jgi:hypothetical protein
LVATQQLEKNFPLEGLNAEERSLVEQTRPGNNLDPREQVLGRQLEHFKRACCGRRGTSPRSLSTDEWWALGRHYGLATPLLDWTRSPYVACFFAFINSEQSSSGKRSVWAFSHNGMLDILINMPENIYKEKYELKTIEIVDIQVDENNRLLNQSGVFTRTPDGLDIEDFISNNLHLTGCTPILFRIDILDTEREAFLRHLQVMNIHSGSLFPDLVGAAEFANRCLEREWSDILWKQKPDFTRRLHSSNAAHN